jgi:hypothetical protein
LNFPVTKMLAQPEIDHFEFGVLGGGREQKVFLETNKRKKYKR